MQNKAEPLTSPNVCVGTDPSLHTVYVQSHNKILAFLDIIAYG